MEVGISVCAHRDYEVAATKTRHLTA